jgi:type II secretory pathway pseudopilin PulG
MIELLISMALASVGLLGLLALQVTATRGNASSRQFVEAVGIAQERLETVQLALYAGLGGLAEGTCAPPTNNTTAAISGGTPVATTYWPTPYTRCTTVTVAPGGLTTYVRVMVQWQDFTNVGAAYHYVTVETTRSP